MKELIATATLSLAIGCAEDKTTPGPSSQGNPLGSSNQSSGSKPYMSEVLRRYGAPGEGSQLFGLWNNTQTFTSADGKITVDGFLRITKDNVTNIAACMNNETKKYILAPSLASVPVVKKSDGSYGFTIPRELETEIESNGITCRSSLAAGEAIVKIDERGMLLIKKANEVQFGELERVK